MRTLYCLYRNNPFRVYFEGHGFQRPKQDEGRSLRCYTTEKAALFLAYHLPREQGVPVLVTDRTSILRRIKNDFET